jgi:hypothetical protein
LAVDEHIEHRAHRADVLAERAVIQQVRQDPKELAQHHADGLHPIGDFDAREFFQREHVGEVVHHAAEIVDAIGVRNVAVPRLAFAHVFGATMVVADVGHAVDDHVGFELQHDAKPPCADG